MRTPAQIAGHPIHPMLVTIPIGLWIFSLVCDFVALRSGAPGSWEIASFYAMVGGILGALAAAIPGLVDLMSLRDKPVFSTALTHMGLNLAIVVLYIVNAWLRWADAATGGTPLMLSLVAIAMLLVSGWLGGKMVYEAGVGVHADEATGAVSDRSWKERAGAPRTGWSPASASPDRAMASDSARPRDTGRTDKPTADRSSDNLGK